MLATIGLVIDVVIIATIVILGLIGLKKGFLDSIISLFSWVVCIIIAILIAKYVAVWINGIYDFSSLIGGKITESLSGSNEFFNLAINSEVFAGDANNILTAASSAGVEGFIYQIIKIVFTNSNVDMSSDQTVATYVGSSLGHISMLIISAILVFIILMIAVAIIKKIFNKIAQTKILGGLNKLLGLVFGALKACVIIVVINCALVGLTLIPAVNKTITPLVQDNTKIEKFIYNKTDGVVEKYLVEGEALQNWINSLWETRKN